MKVRASLALALVLSLLAPLAAEAQRADMELPKLKARSRMTLRLTSSMSGQ